MRSLRSLLILSLCCVVPQIALADETAPFGLTWGMSVETLRDQGVYLRALQADQSGRRYAASDLPKMLSDVEDVILSFGMNDKLHRVVAISRDFRYDFDGEQLKARYAALSRALAAKYGPGEETHDVNRPWHDPQNFLMGIHLGSSRWYSDFESEEVAVRLAITAKRRDIGNYVLTYRNKALEKRSNELPGESDAL